jgi:hypothetical protein
MSISFKKIESHEYHRAAKETAKTAKELGMEKELETDVLLERSRVLRRIESATGIQFAVGRDPSQKSAAAWIETGTKKVYMAEDTLSNERMALHAAHHENEHRKNGFFWEVWNSLDSIDAQTIQTFLGKKTDLVEGFNEMITMQKHGRNENVAYLQNDVPAAIKLEHLANQLGFSLKTFFAEGNLEMFVMGMERVAEHIRTRKNIANLFQIKL